MAIPQQKFREIVFQLLYAQDMGAHTPDSLIPLIAAELEVSKSVVKKAQDRVDNIQPHLKSIDDTITQTSKAYAFERIHSIERNVLRLGVFELVHERTIPEKVVIAEAMRLCRKFSTKEGAAFVNAILDAIYKTMHGEKLTDDHLKKTAEQLQKSEEAASQASHQTETDP